MGEAASSAPHRLAGLVHGRLDDLVAGIAESVVDIPSYRNGGDTLLADAAATARHSVLGALALATGDTSAAELEDSLREVGRRRARQRVPLHDVLRAYQLGGGRFFDELVATLPATDGDESRADLLAAGSRMIFELLQKATFAVSEGYMAVAQSMLADEEHEEQAAVDALVSGRPGEAAAFLAHRHPTGAGLAWCLAMLVDGDASDRINLEVRRLRTALPGAVVGRREAIVVAFVAGSDAPQPEAGGPLGLASVIDGATADAFRRARGAARVAAHLGWDRARFGEVAPLALMLDAPAAEQRLFVETRLGPLLADQRGGELVETVDAFYRTRMSVAAAAREMHVHRHTLEYRLERAEQILGADLRDRAIRLFVESALVLWRYDPPPADT